MTTHTLHEAVQKALEALKQMLKFHTEPAVSEETVLDDKKFLSHLLAVETAAKKCTDDACFAIESLRSALAQQSPTPLWPDDDPKIVAMAERVKELEAALEQQPVGYTNSRGDAYAVKWSGGLPPNLTLYAAPPALPPAPAAQLLTDEQIDAITLAQWGECPMMNPDARRKWSRLLARAIESAHGIGVNT